MPEQLLSSITVNLIEGSFTISGSEAFVEANRETIMGFIEKNTSSVTRKQTNLANKDTTDCKSNTENHFTEIKDIEKSALKSDKYIVAGIYSINSEDDSVLIHKKIPGDTKAEKMKNVALIVLYQKGKIFGSEIKMLCKKQNCLDSSNFSTVFEKDIENFIKTKTSGQKWTIELTVDGESAAVKLLEDMLANAKAK